MNGAAGGRRRGGGLVLGLLAGLFGGCGEGVRDFAVRDAGGTLIGDNGGALKAGIVTAVLDPLSVDEPVRLSIRPVERPDRLGAVGPAAEIALGDAANGAVVTRLRKPLHVTLEVAASQVDATGAPLALGYLKKTAPGDSRAGTFWQRAAESKATVANGGALTISGILWVFNEASAAVVAPVISCEANAAPCSGGQRCVSNVCQP